MHADVKVRAQAIDWTVFPCLKAVLIDYIMGGFPVVEGFITVMDRIPEAADQLDRAQQEKRQLSEIQRQHLSLSLCSMCVCVLSTERDQLPGRQYHTVFL